MSGFLFFIEGILPYIAIIVFVLGSVYRLWYWMQTPVPLRINLAPSRTTWKGVSNKIAAEALLFISLFRNDKPLWAVAWTMHISALVVLLGTHLFGLIDAGIDLWTLHTIPGSKTFLYVAATFAFPLLATLFILLLKRIFTRDIIRISVPTDYLIMALILIHVANGTYMSFYTELDMAEVMKWGMGLATFKPYVIKGSWIFAFHVTTAFTLFMYFPFSKLFHPLGQIVNRLTMTQKEEPLIPGGSVVK
jgi:nitrate reductase gamma subunit